MVALVSEVLEGSRAEELGIEAGDVILSIDGVKLRDMIDYKFMTATEELTIEILKKNGEVEEIEFDKVFEEDLGIVFESAVFDKIKPCLNKCIFCFVDQQPKGLRKTLYIKDDDYRLSYLQGTYITLTNLKDEDKQRIKSMGLGPFYVSVHTTNPELRVKMLRNPNASKIMDELKWFKKNNIPFHAQIVLCPGFNDGEELDRTLSDLTSLKSALLSVAIVPVGITHFREGSLLKEVTKEKAIETIEIASKYKKVCCSDEFFLKAGYDIPPKKYYGKYSQLADGVGSLRLLLEDFKQFKLPKKIQKPLKLIFATSVAASKAVDIVAEKLNVIEGFSSVVAPVKSEYWGKDITVAGLITSDDLVNTVKDLDGDMVVIPSVMLKPYSEDFLDGNNLDYVKEKSGKEFFVVKNSNSFGEVVELIKLYK